MGLMGKLLQISYLIAYHGNQVDKIEIIPNAQNENSLNAFICDRHFGLHFLGCHGNREDCTNKLFSKSEYVSLRSGI